MVEKRHFSVVGSDVGAAGGRYTGTVPSAVAKKAANKIFKTTKKTTVEFFLKEITNGSAKKEYAYQATKKELNPPKVIMIAGKEVTYKHEIKVKALVHSHHGGME